MTNNYNFSKESSLIAYLDLSNMFHWQDTLKWNFSVYETIKQLKAIKTLKEIRVYYGFNEREFKKSKRFHKSVMASGATLITKPVKWIKKNISKRLFVKNATLEKLDQNAHSKLEQFINCLNDRNIEIEEPKCNFDVEMSLDMLDNSDKISGILLFSGDSDFYEPLERLRIKGKSIYIFGVRGQVARELWQVCSFYVDFGKWYKGSKKRKSRS